MPLYNYKCPKCGFEFEKIVSNYEKEVIYCPKCNVECEREFPNSVSHKFVGGGFYTTDYKNK